VVSAFHRQRADGFAGIFDDVAGAAGGADLADDGKDDVLGGDAGRQLPVDTHQHVLRLLLDQRLGRQHMLDFRRADAVGERAEGAMRRGVAVAADDGHPRQGEALLRPDNVDDALPAVGLVIIFDAEIGGVLRQRLDLNAAFLVLDAEFAVGRGRHVVVDDGQRLRRLAHRPAGHAQPFEGLRAGDLVDEMAVDIDQAGAVFLPVDDVVVKNLVVKRARCGHFASNPSI
jgi:hypothetical protein